MRHSTSKLGNTFTWLGWIIGFALLALLFQKLIDQQNHPNREIGSYIEGNFHQIELERNRQGHYLMDGPINGQPVTFLLDTGATTTSMPAQLGEQLGLEPEFATKIQTANGVTKAYQTRLASLQLGDIEFKEVRATLIPGFSGNQILLGMNILQHLELLQQGDRLLIRSPR